MQPASPASAPNLWAALRQHAAQPLPEVSQTRDKLRLITLAWVLGSVWLFTVTGAVLTQFAIAIKVPLWGFGLMAAIPQLGVVGQVLGSYLVEKKFDRKRLFLATLLTSRLMWLGVAAMPWVLPGMAAWWWPMFAILLTLCWMSGNLGGPAWMAWMAEVIPKRVRGRYMARRSQVAQPLAVAFTLGVGAVLDTIERAHGSGSGEMLRVCSLILAVAALLGTADILLFRRVPDPGGAASKSSEPFFASMKLPLRNRSFVWFLGYQFVLMLGIGFLGQYIPLMILQHLDRTNLELNLATVAIPLVVQMLTVPMWGRLMDRVGKKPVIVIAGTGVVFGPVGWFFTTPDNFWMPYILTLLSPLCFSALMVANFNVLLDLSENRGQHRGSAYTAVNALAVGLGGVISGLLASLVATRLEGMQIDTGMGTGLNLYTGMLLGSMLLRALAVFLSLRIHEPKAEGTKDTLRYMTVAMWSNARGVWSLPTRGVGHMKRWSYRASGKPEPRRDA